MALICPLVRQTNIVWVIYICFKAFLNKHKKHFLNQDARLSEFTFIYFYWSKFARSWYPDDEFFIFTIWQFRIHRSKVFRAHSFSSFIWCFYILESRHSFRFILNTKFKWLSIGHKEFHTMTFHPTQMLYLLIFIFLQLPISIYQYFCHINLSIFQIFRSKTLLTLFSLLNIFFSYIVYNWTYLFCFLSNLKFPRIIHPFILSDNRHYIFYIFKNFFIANENFKYYLCPVYALIMIYLYPLVISKFL